MPDFSNLKALELDPTQEREFKFYDIKGNPSIWLLPATEANKPFMNETLRRSALRAKMQGNRKKQATTDTIAKSRDEDRELIANHCAQRWNMTDAKDKPVDFSAENCLDFFKQLPDWLFDKLRVFASDETNWLGEVVDGGELGEH